MKKATVIISILFLSVLSTSGQDLIAFINDTTQKSFSIKEFRNYSTLNLNDTSLKVKSYVAFFVCHSDYQMKKGRIKDVSVVTVNGNSLKADGFVTLFKKYKDHFYIVFDNILFIDKNGMTKGAISPGRIDITN